MAAAPGGPDDRISREQAALRRVATLAARGVSSAEVFAAVAEEAGQVLDADFTFLSRYNPDKTATIVASWSRIGADFPADTRVSLRGRSAHTRVFQTARAARIEDYADASRAGRRPGPQVRPPPVGRRADQCRGPAVGRHVRGAYGRRAAAVRHRGAASPASPSWPPPRSRTRRRAWSCTGSPGNRPRCGGWRRWSAGRRRRKRCSPRSPRRPGGCWTTSPSQSILRYDTDGSISVAAARA